MDSSLFERSADRTNPKVRAGRMIVPEAQLPLPLPSLAAFLIRFSADPKVDEADMRLVASSALRRR